MAMKIPPRLKRAHEFYQAKYLDSLPEPIVKPRDYFLRWRLPCVVVLSMGLISAVFIVISSMETTDIPRFCVYSSLVIAITWLGFWRIRFSRLKKWAMSYIVCCSFLYVFFDFIALFKNNTGKAYILYKTEPSAGVVGAYIVLFYFLFLWMASLLEEGSLMEKIGKWRTGGQ